MQYSDLGNIASVTDNGGYSAGATINIKISKLGKIIVFGGSYSTGEIVSSNLNTPLFVLPEEYKNVHQFNFIGAAGSDTHPILFYCNGISIYTRERLEPKTAYSVAGCTMVK